MGPSVRHVVSQLAAVAAASVIVVAASVAPAAGPAGTVRTGPAIPWAARYRSELLRSHDRGTIERLAVGIGAALAWDLADLRRHRDPLPLVSGRSRPGPILGAPLLAGRRQTDVPGGAIGAMIARWNDLYPPYALEMDEQLASGVAATDTNQSRSGACPGNRPAD